jgi:hypothetical protein
MGVIVGLMLGFGVLVVVTLVGAGILSLATSLAGIEGRTFGKALTATVGAAIAGFVVGIPLSILGVDGGLFASAVGLLTYLAVIRAVYDTSWGKALLAWFLELVVVAILLVPLFMLGGLAALMG